MNRTASKSTSPTDVKRGPNQEAVNTAQDNVTEGFNSPGKASIISGKPDGDVQGGAGRNNDQGKAPPDAT